jgi:RalA-binding protein 1
MENAKIFGPPMEITTPVTCYPADTPLSGVTPESIRSARNQLSGDIQAPSYMQKPSSREGHDSSLAAHKENGAGAYSDRFSTQNSSRNAYSTQLNNPMSKQAKRESNTLFMNLGAMAQREPALGRLREGEVQE